MFLRELSKSGTITVSYYKDGTVQTCKGRVHDLNLHHQILSVKDENEAVISLLLSEIKSIH
ncbi:YolD-like family protein [Priestia aryabhattai]|uniref:YolD-like family protein n=1 Tax=Priestia megaterium TaxID=1404 RepID=UPI0039B974BF